MCHNGDVHLDYASKNYLPSWLRCPRQEVNLMMPSQDHMVGDPRWWNYGIESLQLFWHLCVVITVMLPKKRQFHVRTNLWKSYFYLSNFSTLLLRVNGCASRHQLWMHHSFSVQENCENDFASRCCRSALLMAAHSSPGTSFICWLLIGGMFLQSGALSFALTYLCYTLPCLQAQFRVLYWQEFKNQPYGKL